MVRVNSRIYDIYLIWFDGPNDFEISLNLVQNVLDFIDVCKKVRRARFHSIEGVIEGCPLII